MEYLFINNKYCTTIDDLKSMLSNRENQKDKKNFIPEILAYFKDGVLAKWCEEHGYKAYAQNLKNSKKQSSDIETFKSIVKSLTGKEVSVDIDSKFNEVARLIRVDYNNQKCNLIDGTIELCYVPGVNEVKFTFEILKQENKEYEFSLNENKIRTKNWKNNIRGSQTRLSFNIAENDIYELKEGDNNVLCLISTSSKRVDLGLSVYWANRNLGANSPEDKGDYKDRNKIGKEIEEQFGEGWRLPTVREFRELVDKCHKETKRGNLDKINKVTFKSKLNNGSIIMSGGGVYDTSTLSHYFDIESGKSQQPQYVPTTILIRPVHDK